jgi:phage baseplate assembly protein W
MAVPHGFGAPWAVTPYGSGTPISTAAPPGLIYRAAYIDPITRDYVVVDDGNLGRMPIVRQQMLLALLTQKGSSTVLPNFGLELPKKIDENTPRLVRFAVERAVAHITGRQRAKLLDVVVEQPTMIRLQLTVSYRDLTIDANDLVVTRYS